MWSFEYVLVLKCFQTKLWSFLKLLFFALSDADFSSLLCAAFHSQRATEAWQKLKRRVKKHNTEEKREKQLKKEEEKSAAQAIRYIMSLKREIRIESKNFNNNVDTAALACLCCMAAERWVEGKKGRVELSTLSWALSSPLYVELGLAPRARDFVSSARLLRWDFTNNFAH